MALVEEFPDTRRGSHDAVSFDEGGGLEIGSLLRNVLALVRRNLWLIIAVVGMCLVLALVVTMLQAPRYTAQATIEINDRSEQVLGEDIESSSADIDGWDIERFLNTQIDILRSRALSERVAQRLDLYASDQFFAAMQAPLADEYDTESERRNAALELLMENFGVRLPGESRVAQLSFTSTDAQLSASIANAFSAEFIQSSLQRRFDSSSYARGFVADQLEEARARLEASERELNAYARDAGLIRMRDSSNEEGSNPSITAASLSQLNLAANQAQAERVAAEAKWNAERSQPLLASPAVLASPTVQKLLATRSEVQAELASVRARYLDDHPSIQRLEDDLETVEAQLNQAANEARNTVRAEYLAAANAEERLVGSVDALELATLQEQDRAVRYNTLAREADTNRQIYEGLLQRYRELNASAGITSSNISVIDRAEPPTLPSSPNLLVNLALSILIGGTIAAAIVFLKDQLDDRVRIPEEVESKVGLSVLGVIPKDISEEPLQALADPKSAVSEAYNSLRSSLLYSTPHGLPKTLLLTSAQPSEGKSTSSFAIANSVARSGRKVLLVDADLRRPSIHRILGISNNQGLSSVLVGESDLDSAIVPGPIENLYVLPSGPIPPTPAELLSSPRFGSLAMELPNKFDFVVFDTAPVLGLADAAELSALVEGVLLVIESDRGGGGQLKTAIRRLQAMKPNLLGAVLTKFDAEKAGNPHSAYYGYEYYRYEAGEERA